MTQPVTTAELLDNPVRFKEAFHRALRDGAIELADSYLTDLLTPDKVSVEDKRKGLDLIAKIVGLEQVQLKQLGDGLTTFHFTFQQGVGATATPPEMVVDVTPHTPDEPPALEAKELATVDWPFPGTPAPAPETTPEEIDNELDALDALLGKI